MKIFNVTGNCETFDFASLGSAYSSTGWRWYNKTSVSYTLGKLITVVIGVSGDSASVPSIGTMSSESMWFVGLGQFKFNISTSDKWASNTSNTWSIGECNITVNKNIITIEKTSNHYEQAIRVYYIE